MRHIKYFDSFLTEKEDKKGDKPAAPKPAAPEKVDTSEGTMKEMDIDGKKYMAVLTTFSALGSKQSSMGQDIVGMISLPGSDSVWELFDKEEAKK
jgi:hypothetical protein